MARLTSFALIITLFLVIGGCDHQGANIPTSPPTANSYLGDGWTLYESGNYAAALTEFNASKARDAIKEDAYNGLGWTYTKLTQYDNAISNFLLLLSLTSSDDMRANVYAGLAMTYSAMQVDPNYYAGTDDATFDQRTAAGLKAIEYIDMVLALKPDFEFTHDTYITAQKLNATVAQCYFRMKRFLDAAMVVTNTLYPDFFNNLSSQQVIVVRSDTVAVSLTPTTGMTGQANLDVVYSVNDAPVSARLVDVIDVRHSETNVSYKVVEFVEGGKSVKILGNPIPMEKDMFVVQYQNATDYGKFLSVLMNVIDENTKRD
ncbi:hypothetical protein JW960_25335 [candidate division KSB1 bacterium]|nr:hypothetical protein [candidate division KSB1 bacterium]